MPGLDESGSEMVRGAGSNKPSGPRPLWYWAELASAVGASAATTGPEVTGVSIDSRTVQPGDLFIALAGDPGPRFFTSSPGARDGHEFLDAARIAGAAGALVSQSASVGFPQLRVADTLDGLWALGAAAVERHQGARVAVTGSSGKTTAKAFLAAALQAVAEPGSLNNFWGVPLSLARTPCDAPYAVYEIGTNRAGEIAPLSTLARPDVAIVLNVHPAHIGNFSSLDALREEKLSISKGLEDISSFVCEYSVAHAAGLEQQVVTFGEQSGALVRLLDLLGDRARILTPRGTFDARVPGGGRHRALTLTAVVATLLALDLDPSLAAELPAALVPKGRGDERLVQRANGGRWVLVDDSYNANPTSMAAALTLLAEGQKAEAGASATPAYAILGEMLELGADSESYHRGLLKYCEAIDGVYCVGAGARALYEALPPERRLGYAPDARQIDVPALVARLPVNGRLLLKGSNRVFWQSQFCNVLAMALEAAH